MRDIWIGFWWMMYFCQNICKFINMKFLKLWENHEKGNVKQLKNSGI